MHRRQQAGRADAGIVDEAVDRSVGLAQAAHEVGTLGITVNAVAPGFIDTDMTGGMSESEADKIRRRSALKRMATVEDVAQAVSYLLSDKARNVTGTVLTVDAGGTA